MRALSWGVGARDRVRRTGARSLRPRLRDGSIGVERSGTGEAGEPKTQTAGPPCMGSVDAGLVQPAVPGCEGVTDHWKLSSRTTVSYHGSPVSQMAKRI